MRRRPDHPRACGANMRLAHGKLPPYGSSPRMRGEHVASALQCDHARIIPAHAGQTPCTCRASRRFSDHPRACGANHFVVGVWEAERGSSPRMRGKLLSGGLTGALNRIIPAHAGQTADGPFRHPQRTDHPRACGANPHCRRRTVWTRGSSPRMRGKPQQPSDLRGVERIIPAHAGQTSTRSPAATPRPDHPRACGANHASAAARRTAFGSSPRMRGKRGLFAVEDAHDRIIPAHAGQTCSARAH